MSSYWMNKYFELTYRYIGLRTDREEQVAANIRNKAKRKESFTIMNERLKAQADTIKYLKRQNHSLRLILSSIDKEKRCRKAKFYSEDEALEFAILVGKRTGEDFITYECSMCRKSTNGYSYYHITHEDEELRGLYK